MGVDMNTVKSNGRIQCSVVAALAVGLLCWAPAWLAAQEAQPAQPPAPAAQTPAAQTPGPTANQQPVAPVIKTESRLVLVDAVVTDKKGNYIHDLKQSDFRVFEDNKEQTVASFSSGTDARLTEA